MALVAIPCAIAHRYEQRLAAFRYFGLYTTPYASYPAPPAVNLFQRFLIAILGDDAHRTRRMAYSDEVAISGVSLSGVVTGAKTSQLYALPEIEDVSFLDAYSVNDDALSNLAPLRNLRHLYVSPWPQRHDSQSVRPDVSDVGMKYLSGLTKLEELELCGTQITDRGLRSIKDLVALRYLDLGYTRITDAGIEYLQRMTALEILELNGTQVTDAGVAKLRGLPRLRRLGLDNTKITGNVRYSLIDLPALRQVGIAEDAFSSDELDEMITSRPDVEVQRWPKFDPLFPRGGSGMF